MYGPRGQEHIRARFFGKVNKTQTCWLWTGQQTKSGYGRFKVAGRPLFAHRFSYALHYGSTLPGLLVCHHCDNPTCVRPDHLFIGTYGDNYHDAVSKGRMGTRQRSGRKLTAAQVLEIRAMHQAGILTAAKLARQFGVSRAAISQIVRRLIWTRI